MYKRQVLNSTNIFPPENVPCDSLFNVYLIKIISADNTLLKQGSFYLGSNFSASFNVGSATKNFLSIIDGYGFEKISLVSGYFVFDWSIPQPKFVIPLGIIDDFKESSSLSISVQKLGWILYDGITPTNCLSPNSEDVISRVTLERFEDGYLYNDLVSKEALSQIDPLDIVTLLRP